MSNYAVGLVIVLYLSMLFVIAYVAEKTKEANGPTTLMYTHFP